MDTAISAKQLGKLEEIAESQKPQQIIMDVLIIDPGDHLSQKSDPRDPMDGAFVDESHIAVPISPEFASTVASDMKNSIDANLAGKRTKCDISKWHSLGKQARDMLAENSKHDRSLAAVRDAKTAVADKCKAATLGSNALKTRSNTVGISKTQNADRTAHTEHIE